MNDVPVIASYGKTEDSKTIVLTIGTTRIWYSYRTAIAFQIGDAPIVVHENIWGKTTGKHLNLINADKSIRVNNATFISLWKGDENP